MNLMMWKGLKSTFSRNHCLWRLIFGLCNLFFQIIQKLGSLTRCCSSTAVTHWQRTRLSLHDWTESKCMFLSSCYWTTLMIFVKLFLLSFSNCVDFCSMMCCIVIERELSDKNANMSREFLRMGNFKCTHFRFQNKVHVSESIFSVVLFFLRRNV